MRALLHEQRGTSARTMLDYRSIAVDRLDRREQVLGGLGDAVLKVGMLLCVTAFLFLTLAGIGLMVMGVWGWEWLGLGILCVMLGMGALLSAGWCLDAMR